MSLLNRNNLDFSNMLPSSPLRAAAIFWLCDMNLDTETHPLILVRGAPPLKRALSSIAYPSANPPDWNLLCISARPMFACMSSLLAPGEHIWPPPSNEARPGRLRVVTSIVRTHVSFTFLLLESHLSHAGEVDPRIPRQAQKRGLRALVWCA